MDNENSGCVPALCVTDHFFAMWVLLPGSRWFFLFPSRKNCRVLTKHFPNATRRASNGHPTSWYIKTAAIAQASLPALLEGPQLVLSVVLQTAMKQWFSTFCILRPTRHFVKILASHRSRNSVSVISFTNPPCVTLRGYSDFVSSHRVNVTNVARVLEVIPSSINMKK
jgi:hypothetical protein